MKRESSLSVEQNEEIEDKIKDIINEDLLNIDNKSITECTEFNEIIYDLLLDTTVLQMKNYTQHGKISCFIHCYYVAYYTYVVCKKLHLDYISAARGAMLHDLFLYDWHTSSPADVNEKGLHAWAHPKIALKNACQTFNLNEIEKDIILNHMWPLTLRPPKTKEAFIVSCMDKFSATVETLENCRSRFHSSRIYRYAYIFVGLIIFRMF